MGIPYVFAGAKFAAAELGGIKTIGVSPNNMISKESANGDYIDSMVAALYQNPEVTLSTIQVADALDIFGVYGAGVTTADFSFRALTNQSATRAATWQTVTLYKMFGVTTSITADNQSLAQMSVRCVGIGDSTNHPISIATTSKTYSVEVTEAFTLGPGTINSTALSLQSISIDLTPDVQTDMENGLPYPTAVWLNSLKPVIRATTNDMSALATIQAATTAGLNLTSFSFYLRKIGTTGNFRVAPATEEHIKFSGTGGIAIINDTSGTHGQTGQAVIEIHPIKESGDAALIAYDTTSAIT